MDERARSGLIRLGMSLKRKASERARSNPGAGGIGRLERELMERLLAGDAKGAAAVRQESEKRGGFHLCGLGDAAMEAFIAEGAQLEESLEEEWTGMALSALLELERAGGFKEGAAAKIWMRAADWLASGWPHRRGEEIEKWSSMIEEKVGREAGRAVQAALGAGLGRFPAELLAEAELLRSGWSSRRGDEESPADPAGAARSGIERELMRQESEPEGIRKASIKRRL